MEIGGTDGYGGESGVNGGEGRVNVVDRVYWIPILCRRE